MGRKQRCVDKELMLVSGRPTPATDRIELPAAKWTFGAKDGRGITSSYSR